jgi:hypothetical protein
VTAMDQACPLLGRSDNNQITRRPLAINPYF